MKLYKKDKEFLQYIKDMGYNDLLEIDEQDIPKFKMPTTINFGD